MDCGVRGPTQSTLPTLFFSSSLLGAVFGILARRILATTHFAVPSVRCFAFGYFDASSGAVFENLAEVSVIEMTQTSVPVFFRVGFLADKKGYWSCDTLTCTDDVDSILIVCSHHMVAQFCCGRL